MALAIGSARAHPSPARPPKCEAGDDRRASLQPTRHPLETRSWRAGRPDSKFPASRLSRANQKRSRGTERNVTVPRVVTKEAGQMSSATPVAGTPGAAVSAESTRRRFEFTEGDASSSLPPSSARGLPPRGANATEAGRLEFADSVVAAAVGMWANGSTPINRPEFIFVLFFDFVRPPLRTAMRCPPPLQRPKAYLIGWEGTQRCT